MKISSIEPQKNNNERFNIFVDGEFKIGLSSEAIAEHNLYLGKEFDESTLNKLQNSNEYYKCLNKAFEYLSIRMHSEKELRDKLFKKFEQFEVFQVIDRLKALNYVDDSAFAKAWVESRYKSHGRNALKQELLKKGVSKEVIEEQLSFNLLPKESELEIAKGLIEKSKFENLPKDELFKKAGGFLARRGYSYDIIKKVIEEKAAE